MAKKIDVDLSQLNVPKHVAIILDGNGRWAKKKHMPRKYGHLQGAKAVEQICEDADSIGIKYLTVYAFSTENWNRPEDEVKALMKLLRNYLKDCIKRANNNNMRVRVIGEKSRLSDDIRERIEELEKVTAGNTGLNFTIAINYGSKDEMIRAMRKIATEVKEGKLLPEEIDENLFADNLDTAGIPEPDLLIRTSGEERISNFLLWQIAYSEFYFTDVLWPDFDKAELIKAVQKYSQRDRRFGKVKEVDDGSDK